MSQEPFGDIPLFRELQRLLSSSGGGPVNFEIAKQVATAIATETRADTRVTEARQHVLRDAVHEAEAVLSGFTRLQLTEPIRSEGLAREAWVDATLVAWRWLFDRLGARFLDQLTEQPDEGEALHQVQQVMKQVGPLLMGLQTGTLVGHLALEVISGSDPSIPREGETGIIVVLPNVEALADDYSLDADALVRWVAVQETARHLVVQGVDWVGPYRRSLMTELVDAIEIDADALERRLMDLQAQGLEALQQGVPVDNSIPLVNTPRHEAALARVRAFVGLHEGYAARASSAVGDGLLGDTTKIDEVMARYRATSSDAKDLLANVLGFSLDRDLVATGETFCAAIEKLEGPGELNRVWDAPDNLPTYAELRDPFPWIDRVLRQE